MIFACRINNFGFPGQNISDLAVSKDVLTLANARRSSRYRLCGLGVFPRKSTPPVGRRDGGYLAKDDGRGKAVHATSFVTTDFRSTAGQRTARASKVKMNLVAVASRVYYRTMGFDNYVHA